MGESERAHAKFVDRASAEASFGPMLVGSRPFERGEGGREETKRGGNGEVEGERDRANIAHVCFIVGARDSLFPLPFP